MKSESRYKTSTSGGNTGEQKQLHHDMTAHSMAASMNDDTNIPYQCSAPSSIVCAVWTSLYIHCFLTVKAAAIFSTFTCTTLWINKHCYNKTVQLSSVIYFNLTEFLQLFTAKKACLDRMFLNIKGNMSLSVSTKYLQRG